MRADLSSRPARFRLTTSLGLIFWLLATFAPITTWSRALFAPFIGRLAGGEVLWWFLVVAVYVHVLLIERRPLSSIGFRRLGWMDLLLAIVTGVLLVVAIIVTYNFVFPLLHLKMNAAVMGSIMQTPFWYRFALVTRAAVAEETLFRGYPMERIDEWSGSRVLAGVLSWASFTYAHLGSWGAPQLIVAGSGGILLTILFFWRRNLWANMIAHWLADGSGFLLPH